MAFNVNNLIVSDVLSGTMFTKDGTKVLFGLTDIVDPNINLGSNPLTLTDRNGIPICQFMREKSASLSGSNSTFSMSLLAAQMGSGKKVASEESKLIAPTREEIQIGGTTEKANTSITVSKTPIVGTIVLEVLDGDRSPIGINIPIGPSATTTTASVSDKTITLPTGMSLTAADYIGVYYEYETANAVSAGSYIDGGTISGKFDLEVLFADKCDQSKIYYGHLVFPSAVLDSAVDLSLKPDSNHPFTINAMADYCGSDRELFHVVVPEE